MEERREMIILLIKMNPGTDINSLKLRNEMNALTFVAI